MGRRLFKQGYYRGTITTNSEFPTLASRKEGMYWIINVDADVKDPYMKTAKTPVDPSLTVTMTGDPLTTATASGEIFTHQCVVGSRVIVEVTSGVFEKRYVVTVNSETEAILNDHFSAAVVGKSFTYIAPDSASKKVFLPTGHNDPSKGVYVAGSFSGTVAGLDTAVVINALVGGAASNITLTANAPKTVAVLINEHNSSYPLNAITLISGNGTQVPTANIVLSGGLDATYRHVKGSNTSFTTDLAIGDVIYFLNGDIVLNMEVESIISATEFVAKYAYLGTITGIDTSGESVVYVRDELSLTIANSTNDNLKKKIEWVTLATGDGWAITPLS